MTAPCPKCKQPTRPGARFCPKCGTLLSSTPNTPMSPQPAVPSSVAPTPSTGPSRQSPAVDKVRQAVSQVSSAAAPAVKEAATTAAPVVKDAAVKGWQVSRREMGRIARILTLGGRAAYTELTNPQPVIEGTIVTQPGVAWAGPVSEPGAYLFAIGLLAIWLLLGLPAITALLALAGIAVTLLLLAWQGTRHPYFSTLTYRCLWRRLRRQPAHVAELRCQIQDQATGKHVPVVVLGYDPAGALAANTYVRVYGIPDRRGGSIRAWKVETIDRAGRLAGALTAPRLLPLTVALFLPLLLALPVLIVRLLF